MPYNIHEQDRTPNLPPLSDRGISPEQIRRNHLELEMQFHREQRLKKNKKTPYLYKTNSTYFDFQKRNKDSYL
jgi:hypothetical protein